MRYIVYTFWIGVIILGITFAALNPYVVKINYYVNTATLHLPILLLITLVLGALLGTIVMLPPLLRNQYVNRRLKHRVREIEQEVKNLRSIPINDSH